MEYIIKYDMMKRLRILLLVVLSSVSLFAKESLMTYPAPQGAALMMILPSGFVRKEGNGEHCPLIWSRLMK